MSPTLQPWLLGQRELVGVRQEAGWRSKVVYCSWTPLQKQNRKKFQFNYSFWFLCGSTEEYIQCRLGKFLFLFPTHPRPLVLQFKWSKTKTWCTVFCMIWFQRVTVSRSWYLEGNRFQRLLFLKKKYIYKITGKKQAKFCSLCRFLVRFSFHSMWAPCFGLPGHSLCSAGGNWKRSRVTFERRDVVTGDVMDEPAWPQNYDYYSILIMVIVLDRTGKNDSLVGININM